jgi:hypothetical protein
MGDSWIVESLAEAMEEQGVDAEDLPDQEVEDILTELIEEMSDDLFDNLNNEEISSLNDWRLQKRGFEHRLYQKWKEPIDLLERFLILNQEIASVFNIENREKAAADQDYVFEAIMRLHSKACKTAFAVLKLLKSGHADDAMARWRSIHESAVHTYFIKKYGQKAAQRFLEFRAIEDYFEAKIQRKHKENLGIKTVSDDEMDILEANVEDLKDEHGEKFENFYGWAKCTVNDKDYSFKDMEKEVGLDHLRPYYRMANNSVHSGPKGTLFQLGRFEKSEYSDMMLSGPSNYGLADPAQKTALSLFQVTTVLVNLNPTPERVLTLKAAEKFLNKIQTEFASTQKRIEKEIRLLENPGLLYLESTDSPKNKLIEKPESFFSDRESLDKYIKSVFN